MQQTSQLSKKSQQSQQSQHSSQIQSQKRQNSPNNQYQQTQQSAFQSQQQKSQYLTSPTQQPTLRTIDVQIQTLFSKFDRGKQGHLTRFEIADILTQIFKQFNLNNPVTQSDVNNFLLDYDINHTGDLTRKDFEGVKMLRFMLKQIPVQPVSSYTQPVSSYTQPSNLVNSSYSYTQPYTSKYSNLSPQPPTTIKILPPNPPTPQLRQIIVPVRMLFDIFNKRHDGHLTRAQIGQVINLIFKDFNMPYEVNQLDVQNFLEDFDINHDHQITMEDFKGVDVLHFDIHKEKQMKVY